MTRSRQSCFLALGLAAILGVSTAATPRAQVTARQAPAEEAEDIQKAVKVLEDLTNVPEDGIPKHLLQRAEAIIVIPNLVKGGFVIGAKHGKGILSTRNASTNEWSAPAFVQMTGGSIGWQIGVESVDLVLLVMNKSGVDSLLEDKFTIGGNLSVAAGPVGRASEAATNAQFGSQILAYSRAKGLFAGATLEGAKIHADNDDNEDLYGLEISTRDIVSGRRVPSPVPAPAMSWKAAIKRIVG